jgi:DNA-binding Lrp family transcriptional regulator
MCRLVRIYLTVVKRAEPYPMNLKSAQPCDPTENHYPEGSSVKKPIDKKLGIDQTDIQILRTLQENSHQSCRQLASKVDISSPIASARIKILEDKGLLKGYTAILDPAKLGYDLTAILFLQIEAGYLKNLVSELSQMANIITVYEITGDFDVVAVVKLKGRESLGEFSKNLLVTPHIRKVVTNLSFNVVKEDFKVEL